MAGTTEMLATVRGRRRPRVLASVALATVLVIGPAPALAAPGGDATVQESSKTAVGSGTTKELLVTCPAGQRVTGGGVSSTDTPNSSVSVSGPVDETGRVGNTVSGDIARSWVAHVVNNDDVERIYRVFAICSASSDATIAASSFVTAPGQGRGEATAACPSGRRVVGGGIGTINDNSPIESAMVVSGPLDGTGTTEGTVDGDEARFWFAHARNTSKDFQQFHKVFALCSATSDAVVEETSFLASTIKFGRAQAEAQCPAGRRVTGGGVGTPDTLVGKTAETQLSGPLNDDGNVPAVDGEIARFWRGNQRNTDSSPDSYKVFALCATDDLTTPPVGGGEPGAGGPGVSGPGAGGPGVGGPGVVDVAREATKLQVARASVLGSGSLDVLAPITRLASGNVSVRFTAAGRTTAFDAPIDAANGEVRFTRRLPRAQARAGTGILTLSYPGDADTQPQEVRLRAASGKASLTSARPQITPGRLDASGRISSSARGVVRVQLVYDPAAGATRTLEYSARITNGRWTLRQTLPDDVRDEIAQRRGVVHSYVLFTGYRPAGMRGEMRSFQVLPPR